MTDEEAPSTSRRRLLQVAGAQAVVTGLAGCEIGVESGDSGEHQTVTDSDDGDDTAGDDSGGENGTDSGSEETDEPSDGGETDASFDVDASRNPFFDTHEAFETFRINFEGFELRPVDGEPFRVEADGPEFDLTTLSADDGTDLVETGVPSGRYAQMAVHLPVVEATRADGSGSATVGNTAPHVLDIGKDEYHIEPGAAVTFTLVVAIRESDATWHYELGYESH